MLLAYGLSQTAMPPLLGGPGGTHFRLARAVPAGLPDCNIACLGHSMHTVPTEALKWWCAGKAAAPAPPRLFQILESADGWATINVRI